jgi:hypothetical protein
MSRSSLSIRHLAECRVDPYALPSWTVQCIAVQSAGAGGICNRGQAGLDSNRFGRKVLPVHFILAQFVTETTSLEAKHGVRFESFDYPGSTNTQTTAIAPSGEIVGRYNSADGKQHGFVLRDGAFTTVEVPGATFSANAAWVNASGAIVGSYGHALGGHAYVLAGINPEGDIVGLFADPADRSETHPSSPLRRKARMKRPLLECQIAQTVTVEELCEHI